MMSLTFGLFTQVSGSGPLGPLVSMYIYRGFPDCCFEEVRSWKYLCVDVQTLLSLCSLYKVGAPVAQ